MDKKPNTIPDHTAVRVALAVIAPPSWVARA